MSLLARHALAHPRLWLIAIGLVTLVLAGGLLRLELRTEGAALHPVGHPGIEAAERDRVRFLDPRQVVLLAHAPPGAPSLASPAGFRFLRELHGELRSLSAVRSGGVVSIAGLLRVTPDTAGLSLDTWLASIPEDPDAFAALVERTRQVSGTNGLLLSADGRLAAFYLPLSEDREVPELVAEVQGWLDAYTAAPFELWLTGPEVAEATLGEQVLRDLAVFVPVMMVVITVLLAATLRTPGGVLIPLAEAGLVLVWVFGAMGWAGVPVTLVTTILPVVLMAMAITDELHLLERVQTHAAVRPLPEAVATAIAEVGRPIVATSVTTALGFLSFLAATVVPMRQFGLFTALGILLAMALTFCWIPALIVSLPRAWFVPRASRRPLTAAPVGRLVAARPALALGVGLLAVAACVPGVFRLRVQDAWVDNFAPDAPLVRAEQAFNESFWGSYRFDVVLEAERDFFYGPAGAQLTEEIRGLADGAPHVGGAVTYLEPLAQVAHALGEERRLSSLSALRLADVATVAEMGENRLWLRQLLTDDGDAARARLFANDANYERASRLRDYLEGHLPRLAARYDVAYHYSGDLPVALAVVGAIVSNQLRSIGWALATVALSLFLFFERGRGALIAMVPVVAALTVVFGGMGYAGIPLGIATSMFAALTVGIGVDFGVHFLHRYQHLRRQGKTSAAATTAALASTGLVLRWNAIVAAVGVRFGPAAVAEPSRGGGGLRERLRDRCARG
jgi:predicted RND superfamily exporter protein